MAGGFGGAIKLTGESEYRKALSQITNNLKSLSSEMKVNASAFDKNDKSVETLASKQEMLNKTLEKQKNALKQATSSYNSFKNEVDEQTKAHNELEKEYKDAQAELERIKNTSGEASNEYQDQAKKVDELKKQYDNSTKAQAQNEQGLTKLKVAMDNAQISVNKTSNDLNNLEKELNDSKNASTNASTGLEKLKSTISSQEDELSKLKSQYTNLIVEQGKESDEAKELANSIVNLNKDLNNNKTKLNEAEKSTDELTNSMNDVGKTSKNASDGFTVMKGAMANLVAQGITAVINGFGKLKDSAIQAYEEYDNGADIIIQKTGATGEAAQSLAKSYKNVSKSVVGSFEDIGTSVGEVNTRFGVTGKDLEGLSTKFLKFAELNGTDVNSSIDSVQKTLEAFGLKGKDAGKVLDTFNKVGQDTGISMDTLSNDLMENASIFSQLGLSVHQSATFMGQIEKSGLSTSTAMTALSKASANASAEGKPLIDVLKDTQDKMKNAKNDTEGLKVAYDVFGKKAGAKIYEACKQGTMSFANLSKAMEDNSGSIDRTYESTQDGMDKIKLAFQGAKAEVGDAIASFLDNNKGEIESFIKSTSDGIKALFDFMSKNGGTIIGILSGIATGFTAFKIGGLISSLIPLFTSLWGVISGGTTVMGLLNAVMAANPIGLVATAIGLLVGAFVILWNKCEGFRNFWKGLWKGIQNITATVVNWFNTDIPNAWNKIKEVTSNVWNGIKNVISKVWNGIKSFVSNAINNVKSVIYTVWNGIKTVTSTVWNAIKKAVITPINAVKSVVSSVVNGIKSTVSNVWNGIKATTSNVWNGIKNAISKPLNNARDLVKNVINKIKGFFNFKISWPKIPLPHFSISPKGWSVGDLLKGKIPKLGIDWRAKGGVFDKPTVLTGVGEDGAEAIVPLERNTKWIHLVAQQFKDELMNAVEIPKISVDVPQNNDSFMVNMVDQFKEALSQIKIELDDEELGTFVDKTVTRLVYK